MLRDTKQVVRESKERKRILTPFARKVFTGIFMEFADVPPKEEYGAWAISRRAFIAYREECGIGASLAPSAANADKAINAAYTKFLVNEQVNLFLSGFLNFHLNMALSRPRELFVQLRHLEYRHDWLAVERKSHEVCSCRPVFCFVLLNKYRCYDGIERCSKFIMYTRRFEVVTLIIITLFICFTYINRATQSHSCIINYN
jgi:hypothetical protein